MYFTTVLLLETFLDIPFFAIKSILCKVTEKRRLSQKFGQGLSLILKQFRFCPLYQFKIFIHDGLLQK